MRIIISIAHSNMEELKKNSVPKGSKYWNRLILLPEIAVPTIRASTAYLM